MENTNEQGRSELQTHSNLRETRSESRNSGRRTSSWLPRPTLPNPEMSHMLADMELCTDD